MAKFRPLPPLERLNELFEVVEIPESQLGHWSGLKRKISSGPAKKESVAGCLRSDTKTNRKDWIVNVDNKLYLVSRIIFYMINKINPNTMTIDHVNRNSLDNNIKNLRIATRVTQGHNQKRRSTNKSGAVGVHWYDSKNKWQCYIQCGGPRKHLGYFQCKREAAIAYNKKAVSYGLHKVGKPLNDIKTLTCDCLSCQNRPT